MKKKNLLFIAGLLVIVLFTQLGILTFGKNYTAYVRNPYNSHDVKVEFSQEGIVEVKDIKYKSEYVAVKFRSVKPGTADATATVFDEANRLNNTSVHIMFTVLPTGVLYITGYEYGGYRFTVFGIAFMTVYLFAVCLYCFIHRKKTQFFSYKTMLDLALCIFFGLQSVIYIGLFALSVIVPHRMEGWHVYNLAGFIMSALFLASIPLLVIFAGFMSLSNLFLIRHEGFRINNLFGIFISAVLFIGSIMCVVTVIRNPNSTGVEMSEIRDAVIRSIVSSAFVYFECILFSAIACTQYAARHEPKRNQDFIVILGCKVAKDGKPLPLLRGRIDRALEFYKKQLNDTGRQACFIPSGGKGSDEVISEAECMKNYLVEKGVDESIIFPETQSTTTLENMRFSKKIADGHKENANILFVTTNYHIFRSGIFSAKAGMRADGIGAKTKWYFWPNAQMREFIGLVVSEWKINLLFVAAMVGVSTLFANISTIVSFIAK